MTASLPASDYLLSCCLTSNLHPDVAARTSWDRQPFEELDGKARADAWRGRLKTLEQHAEATKERFPDKVLFERFDPAADGLVVVSLTSDGPENVFDLGNWKPLKDTISG